MKNVFHLPEKASWSFTAEGEEAYASAIRFNKLMIPSDGFPKPPSMAPKLL